MSTKHRAGVGALATSLIALLPHSHALADAIASDPAVQSIETFTASINAFSEADAAGLHVAPVSLSDGRFMAPDTRVLAFTAATDASVPAPDVALPDFFVPHAIEYQPGFSLDAASFDSWLMLVVGAGLIAVQLRRNQRELRRPKLTV